MGCIVPSNIVILVNTYLTICANDLPGEFNYIVCNENDKKEKEMFKKGIL